MIKENPTLKDIYEQIRLVVNTAATKKDLESFATKKDLESFATKDDLKKMEEKMVTKIEVSAKELKLEIGKARDEAFAYADKKSVAIVAKLDEIIDKHEEHENKFKHGLVSAMKRSSLLGAKELKQLEQAI